MSAAQLILDHLVVAARSLEEGAAHIREQLGVTIGPGGAHPLMGTHNRLMSLGGTYLEVLAVNPDAEPPGRSRCFNLDHFDATPQLLTWVMRTRDICVVLDRQPQSGEAVAMSRGDLHWKLSVPKDGSMPFAGAFPSFIEWPGGLSPSSWMNDLGCKLCRLVVEHPEAGEIRRLLDGAYDRDLIDIRSAPAKSIRAEIATPSGLRVLS